MTEESIYIRRICKACNKEVNVLIEENGQKIFRPKCPACRAPMPYME